MNTFLRKVLQDLGVPALQSEPQLFVWHVASFSTQDAGRRGAQGSVGEKRLVLVLSMHVDDLKGAGEAECRRKLIAGLEKEFSALKTIEGSFECVGVMHEQDPKTFEVWTHQQHYVPQVNEIPVAT